MTKRSVSATPNSESTGVTCPKCSRWFKGHGIGSHAIACGVTPADLFWARVNKESPMTTCWLWTGATENPGYGHFRSRGKDHRAHRVAYELEKGAIPAGMQVLHACDVMLCVNPAHLRLGTMQENMAEMKAKGRHKSGSAILTPDQVRAIRKEYKRHGAHNQTNCRALAAKHGVSMAVVWRAARGGGWESVK